MKEQPFPGNVNRLLDFVLDKLGLKNDAALCRILEVPPPAISKLRHHTLPLGPTIMLRIHEETRVKIKELRNYLKE